MPLNLQFILAMSCAVPAIAALIIFRNTENNYYPFFLLLWLAVIVELVTEIPLIYYHNKSAIPVVYGFYDIAEVLLMMLFVKRNNIAINKWFIIIVVATGIVSFLLSYFSNIFPGNKTFVWRYTVIGFLVIILVQSVRLLSNQVFAINLNPFKNSLMIIAFGCVLYYSYFMLVLVFTSLNSTIQLYGKIFSVHQIVNAFTYLIFTWAIICIPRKAKY